MKLEDIDTENCRVQDTIVEGNKICFILSEAYDMTIQHYVKGVRIEIKGWKQLIMNQYIMEGPFSRPREAVLDHFEPLMMIQSIVADGQNVTMEGYGTDGNWLVYVFKYCTYEVITQ